MFNKGFVIVNWSNMRSLKPSDWLTGMVSVFYFSFETFRTSVFVKNVRSVDDSSCPENGCHRMDLVLHTVSQFCSFNS